MKQLQDVAVDEPTEGAEAQGVAAVIYSDNERWAVGLQPDAARALGKRLLELAAEYERRHGTVRQ